MEQKTPKTKIDYRSDRLIGTHSLVWKAIILIASMALVGYAIFLGKHLGYKQAYDEVLRPDIIEKRQPAPDPYDTMGHMSMHDMAKMLEGKTGDALDRAFLEGMIPHHQGAVDMAAYLSGAKHPELRKMGEDIIKSQTAEINQMKQWLIDWGYASGSSIGMTGGHMMNMDDAMREHCRMMPEMQGCEVYR